MQKYTDKDVERFWSKVDKYKSSFFYNGTRCWEWTAGRFSFGYGAMAVGSEKLHTYHMLKSHRIAYELFFGEIPRNLFVCHHCDNASCCNPYHLFLGLPKDNVDDMVNKRRQAKGEKSGTHKLTDSQVSEIRKRYGRLGKGGETAEALAKEFGVGDSQILNIVHYDSRKDVE